MKTIIEFFGVESANELCSYTYNHGDNPELGIYRKEDVICAPTSYRQYMMGGNNWEVKKGSKMIEASFYSEHFNKDLEKMGLTFAETMKFAKSLDEAKSIVNQKF